MFTYPENIFAAIREERNDFLYNHIEIVPGLAFNQYATIKKAHKYYNSHYNSGDYEDIGGVSRKKVFYNISKWRADVATKMIDVDVKDFVLLSENYATQWQTYLLEKEMKAWLKKNKLGKVLNEVVRKLPVYGSVVLKKIKEGAEVVDLRNFFIDQAAESLTKSRYIIEKHLYSAGELRGMRSVWDNVDEAIEKFCNFVPKGYEDTMAVGINQPMSSPYAEVYERYAEVPESWLKSKDGSGDADDGNWVLARFVVTGVDNFLTDKDGNYVGEDGIILFKEKIKQLPYKEVHYSKTEGRWLGIGVIEDVFEAQQQVNKIKDSEAKALELASLIVFQSQDDMANRNLLADVENGDILRVKKEITRVDNTNHALGEMAKAQDSYETLADRSTFSYDLVRGETPPSSTTLGAVQIAATQAASMFDYKRENVGLFLQEFIDDLVFPELAKKINTPHIFRFAGDRNEMEKIRERIVDSYLRSKIFETGEIPSQEYYDSLKQKLTDGYRKASDKVWLKIKKDFFKNLDYEVSLEITGEGKDLQSQLQNISTVLTELARNPELLNNPILKRLLYKQMTLMGMSISELEDAEMEQSAQSDLQMQQQQQAASQRNLGGAAAPKQPTSAQGQVIQNLIQRQ